MIKGPELFPEINAARYGDGRPHRNLFLSRRLAEEGGDRRLEGPQQDHAHEIICKWADLESSGKLANRNETTLEAEFITDVFAGALGYTLFSQGADLWNLHPKFSLEGGIADAAIGVFEAGKSNPPRVLIELKGPTRNLDSDRSQARTPVAQCWDYLGAVAEAQWGIVSNIVSFRLYHRSQGVRAYQLFTLQELRDFKVFQRFYCLFEKGGLLPRVLGQTPRADLLLEDTSDRRRDVGDELYKAYDVNRRALIRHLRDEPHNKGLDSAIRISQTILDRIVFIAFCQSQHLLDKNIISKFWEYEPPAYRAADQRWQNFLTLFKALDKGDPTSRIPPFNGNLFKPDGEIDSLTLEDSWIEFFYTVGGYDFREEVNLDVLGHIFEQSVNDLERLKLGALFEDAAAAGGPKMAKSAQRKRGGVYYTPPEFTDFIVRNTLGRLISERMDLLAKQYDPAAAGKAMANPLPAHEPYWRACLTMLRALKVIDPACGSGAFLIQAYDLLADAYHDVINHLELLKTEDAASLRDQIPDFILKDNLYGVDLSREAGEITQTALWIRSARPGKTLANLSANIICGNSLVADKAVDPLALDWRQAFPQMFGGGTRGGTGFQPVSDAGVPPARIADVSSACEQDCAQEACRTPGQDGRGTRWQDPSGVALAKPDALATSNHGQDGHATSGGFDCVIGNPPWERMKLQEREFFDTVATDIASAVDAATRRKLIAAMEKQNPELHQRYMAAKAAAEHTLDYVRRCDCYPLTGKGDINTYAAFAELAKNIVAEGGMVGLLVPSGIATDHTTKDFFGELIDKRLLSGLYDFENRRKIFPDVDGRFKFSILLFGGAKRVSESADFVFFAHRMDDLKPPSRHIELTSADMKLLNPNTRTCPIFRSRRDAELAKAIYRRVPVLVDRNRKKGGNPWGVKFLRMFDQTNDAELFRTADQLKADKCKRDGAVWTKGKKRFLPLYEAKMVQAYDHRAASVVVKAANWMRQGQTLATSLVDHQNPEYSVEPRWWVDEAQVNRVIPANGRAAYLCFKDVTSPTNMRTMIAAFVPRTGLANSAPLLLTGEEVNARQAACLLANLNSFAFDFVARQKVGGLHLNFFIVEQLPVFSPDFYADKCPWDKKRTLETWISQRVLKLTCTANDMIPLAKAAKFDRLVHKWKPQEREELMAELDAAYMLLYGIERDDVACILSTFSGASDEGGLIASSSASAKILEHYDALRAACE